MKNTPTPLAHREPSPRRSWHQITHFLLSVATALLFSSAGALFADETVPPSADGAQAIVDAAGKVVRQTSISKFGPIYVFEENHASQRGQIQIATMLTRLHKRTGLRLVGLEGSPRQEKPLPTKSFLAGASRFARRDALRRMLIDGDIRATEYVGAVNPAIELWGLENPEEYAVQPPEGISPGFMAVLVISEKLLPEERIDDVVRLIKAEKVKEAMDVLKNGHPWIREQLSATDEDKLNLQQMIEHEQAILKKARELDVELPPKIRNGMDQTIRFYRMADQRSVTLVSNMIVLSKPYAGQSTALIMGAAHTDRVMELFAKSNVYAVLIQPLNLMNAKDDPGLMAFENKNAGLLANDSPNTFGYFLNQTLGARKGYPDRRPPPTFIGNSNPSRNALGSIQYATSIIAEAARAGRRIPDDIQEVLQPLDGGVTIDSKSFWRDGYDVVFCAIINEPDNSKRRIWVRAGTVSEAALKPATDSIENDEKLLAAADGEPPRKPPTDRKSTESEENEPDGNKDRVGRDNKNAKTSSESSYLLDVAVHYKAFSTQAEAKACPMLSSQ